MPDLDLVVPLKADGTATPLYCIHASSGSAYAYLGLARLLGDHRPVYGIEAPGFDGSREPVSSVPILAAEYAEILLDRHPAAGFSLLGWSLGGHLAFEVARQLTARTVPVEQLVLVDASRPQPAPPPSDSQIAERLLTELLAGIGAPPAAAVELPAGTGSGPEYFRAVERTGALPADLDAELLAEHYPLFRAHVHASYGYRAVGSYDGPLLHLIASESPAEQMRWGGLASNLTEQVIPGNHYSIWTGSSLLRIAELVRQAIDRPG